MKVNFLITMIILVISHIGNAQANSYLGAIETPEMQVFYEGVPTQLYVQAIGEYTDVELNIPNPYTAKIGTAGSIVTVTCTGINKRGKRVQLEGQRRFTVKKAPKPELYWGGNGDGSKIRILNGELKIAYPESVPLLFSKKEHQITKYMIIASNLKGSLEGVGGTLSQEHIQALKKMPNGTKVSILVNYSGENSGFITAMFEL
jgi:hypothetical protein